MQNVNAYTIQKSFLLARKEEHPGFYAPAVTLGVHGLGVAGQLAGLI